MKFDGERKAVKSLYTTPTFNIVFPILKMFFFLNIVFLFRCSESRFCLSAVVNVWPKPTLCTSSSGTLMMKRLGSSKFSTLLWHSNCWLYERIKNRLRKILKTVVKIPWNNSNKLGHRSVYIKIQPPICFREFVHLFVIFFPGRRSSWLAPMTTVVTWPASRTCVRNTSVWKLNWTVTSLLSR